VRCAGESAPAFSNCIIAGNKGDVYSPGERGDGVYAYDAGHPTLINCTIVGNRVDTGGGKCSLINCIV
jgi:hypothetical protein